VKRLGNLDLLHSSEQGLWMLLKEPRQPFFHQIVDDWLVEHLERIKVEATLVHPLDEE